ncbi:MAG TPA: SWIM zinc finger family protein, partial [Isosphaeraceae bacterium]|nr:SWIM zinc finger family protein [Isosphaeraceae bacterium]
MPWWNDDDRYFPPSKPRKARGGIKARSARGEFGENWWAKRWVQVLEGFGIGSRLERGRRYARAGQVLSIAVEKGRVRARVQGSRPKPYEVAIHARPLSDADWDRVTSALSAQALYAAKLLAGEMPQQIEQVFEESGLSLFPSRLGDLTTKCSCPDMANPCKHIASVY